MDLPAPPPEFDLEVWETTIDRLVAENFSAIYPTHFSRVDEVDTHFIELKQLLREAAFWIKAKMDDGVTRDDLVEQFNEWNRTRARQVGLNDDAIHQYETANPGICLWMASCVIGARKQSDFPGRYVRNCAYDKI